MTEQQIDRAFYRDVAERYDGYGNPSIPAEHLLALLDQLDQAEAELGSWMARAYEAEGKLWKAEARIKAVRALHTGTRWPGVTDKPICDACDRPWPCPTTRALYA